jgi:hypothetical protein
LSLCVESSFTLCELVNNYPAYPVLRLFNRESFPATPNPNKKLGALIADLLSCRNLQKIKGK